MAARRRSYRHWAKGHPSEYALVFGTRLPDLEQWGGAIKEQHQRGVAALFRVMLLCLAQGTGDLGELEASLTPALRAQLAAWRADAGVDLPPAALAGCVTAWTQLHGLLALELFGGFPPQLEPLDELFDQQMRQVLARIGYRGPVRTGA